MHSHIWVDAYYRVRFGKLEQRRPQIALALHPLRIKVERTPRPKNLGLSPLRLLRRTVRPRLIWEITFKKSMTYLSP